jgi:hypothetical protein
VPDSAQPVQLLARNGTKQKSAAILRDGACRYVPRSQLAATGQVMLLNDCIRRTTMSKYKARICACHLISLLAACWEDEPDGSDVRAEPMGSISDAAVHPEAADSEVDASLDTEADAGVSAEIDAGVSAEIDAGGTSDATVDAGRCDLLSVTECLTAKYCGPIFGHRYVEGAACTDEDTPVGCFSLKEGCGLLIEYASDPDGGLWQLTKNCIPAGWTRSVNAPDGATESRPACGKR